MVNLLSAFWRAFFYCLHPRVLALSLLPTALLSGAVLGLGYFFAENAVYFLGSWLKTRVGYDALIQLLQSVGLEAIQGLLAHIILILLITPFLVISALFLTDLMISPSIVSLVTERRFSFLERRADKAGWIINLGSTLWTMIAAFGLLVLTSPLWVFVPPLLFLILPFIWAWLTYRLMSFDALGRFTNVTERKSVLAEHRGWLMVIGIVIGYLCVLPSLIWAWGLVAVALFPFLLPLSIWMYCMVFSFAGLWYAHYCLAALEQSRLRNEPKYREPEPEHQTVTVLENAAATPAKPSAPSEQGGPSVKGPLFIDAP